MFDRQGNRKYLNWPEREAYFQAVKRDSDLVSRAFCLTLFYTGCRISEALQLNRDRIDFTEKALVFETLKQRQRGNFRAIPIPDALVELFERLLVEHPPDGSVWPYSRTTAYRLIKRRMADAKIAGVKACPKPPLVLEKVAYHKGRLLDGYYPGLFHNKYAPDPDHSK